MHSIDQPSNPAKAGTRERRRDARFLATYPAALTTVFGQRQLCVCHDMSSVGGLFLTSTEYRPGDAVQLDLFIRAPDGEPHRTMARVARVQKRQLRNVSWAYEMAVEFASPTRELTAAAKALSEQQHTGT